MTAPTMTLVVNGNAYKLSATNTASLTAVSPGDRQALLAVLEALKRCDQAAEQTVEQAVAIARRAQPESTPGHADQAEPIDALKVERMGSGDVDALMARLIAEDQQSRKSQTKSRSLIKAVAALLAVIVLLVMIF